MSFNPSTLLCESCGYPIEGLPGGANCPECGVDARSSLPDARPGSPWQQHPGLRSFLRTNWLALRRPRDLFRIVRLDSRSGATLLAINLLIAATAALAPWSGTLLDDPIRRLRGAQAGKFLATALLVIPAQILAIAAFLLLLTAIEWVGIQHFARRRGARLCRLAAWQVVCHASIGWVVASTFVMLTLAFWLNVSFAQVAPRLSSYLGGSNFGAALVPAAGAVAGLLVFETLVAIGVRRCRFANRPRQTVPA